MRINLQVPYEENTVAKSYGARWDAQRKTWWVDTERVSPDWLMKLLTLFKQGHSKSLKSGKVVHKRPGPVVTEINSDGSIPDCGCTDVAPWRHCAHSEPALTPEEREQLDYALSRS